MLQHDTSLKAIRIETIECLLWIMNKLGTGIRETCYMLDWMKDYPSSPILTARYLVLVVGEISYPVHLY